MVQTLLVAGVACLIAAIVGGGLTAFQVQLPALKSRLRQGLLAILGLGLIGASYFINKPIGGAAFAPALAPAPANASSPSFTTASASTAQRERAGAADDTGLKVRDCSHGPDTCLAGYVWRDATAADHVCVTSETHDVTQADNEAATSRRDPGGGPYGPDTCRIGFVWRDIAPTDHVCVTPETRTAVQDDNQAAASRKACT
jgi:hypothetical protein